MKEKTPQLSTKKHLNMRIDSTDPLFGNNLNKPVSYSEKKYQYALEQVVYYSVLTDEFDTLSYYKDGITTMAEDAPAVLRYIASEFAAMEFHQRFWAIRDWVNSQNKINPACGIYFLFETMAQMEKAISLTVEEESIIAKALAD